MGNLCSRDRKDETETEMPEINNPFENAEIECLIYKNVNSVHLLRGRNVVKKQFGEKERQNFFNEVETYRVLQGLPFILKPLFIDLKKHTIYLPFIDGKPQKNSNNKLTLSHYLNILKHRYGIWREGEFVWNNLLQDKKTNQIFLIDFGNVPWNSSVSNTKWRINRSLHPVATTKEEQSS